jgi:DNA-binding transcriptional MerR regulator
VDDRITINSDISVKVKSEVAMRIGMLSEVTGASARSLRHYEKLGLIASEREPNGYRDYGADAVDAVRTIRQLLALGFPSPLIEQILPCTTGEKAPDACDSVYRRVTEIRDDLDAKVDQLVTTRDLLTEYLAREAAGNPAGSGDPERSGDPAGAGDPAALRPEG